MNPNNVFLKYFSQVQPLIRRQQMKISANERRDLTREIKRCDRMMALCTNMDDFDVQYITSITGEFRK